MDPLLSTLLTARLGTNFHGGLGWPAVTDGAPWALQCMDQESMSVSQGPWLGGGWQAHWPVSS